jgi:hypothetical protein
MNFPLEKILTVSAEEWSQSSQKLLIRFDMVGVTYSGDNTNKPKTKLAEKVPDEAEVVVNYAVNRIGPNNYEANGTALIPKSK